MEDYKRKSRYEDEEKSYRRKKSPSLSDESRYSNQSDEESLKKASKKREKRSLESKSSSTQSRNHKKKSKKDKKRKEKSKHRSRSKRENSISKKKKSHRKRSRSVSSQKQKKHKNKKSHSKKRNLEKSRSNSPKRSYDREKRSRTRSPAPQTRKFRIQQPLAESMYGVQKKFWDGFQWIVRTNSVPNDQNALNLTRKMRRISVSNLPLYYGITERDIATILAKFMVDNYLADPGNKTPVLAVQVNSQQMTALIELSSVEETNRIVKVDSIRIFNHNCKITRVGENLYGTSFNLANLVTNAQTSAQAQAAALAAMDMVQKSDTKQLLKTSVTPPSRIIKVANVVEPIRAPMYQLEELMRMEESILEEFGKHGKIIDGFLVKPFQIGIGGFLLLYLAELCSVFIEFETVEESENAMNEMFSKKLYDREIKMIFIPEDIYNASFKPLALKFQNN